MKTPKSITIFFLFTFSILFIQCASTISDWKATKELDTTDGYEQFITKHPTSAFADSAKKYLVEMKWELVQKEKDLGEYMYFLNSLKGSDYFKVGEKKIVNFLKEHGKRLSFSESQIIKKNILEFLKNYKQYGGNLIFQQSSPDNVLQITVSNVTYLHDDGFLYFSKATIIGTNVLETFETICLFNGTLYEIR